MAIEKRPAARGVKPLGSSIVLALVALTAVPLLILGTIEAVIYTRARDEVGRERLIEAASSLCARIDADLDMHLRAVQTAAGQVSADGPGDVRLAQERLQRDHALYPGFLTMIVADRSGQVIARHPLRTRDGHPLPAGPTVVEDRSYFRVPRDTLRPHISGVFRGRGFGTDTIVAVSAPILTREGGFAGIVEGSLDLSRQQTFMSESTRLPGTQVIVIDALGHVVFSSGAPGYPALASATGWLSGTRTGQVVQQRVKGEGQVVARSQTKNGWTVIVARPVRLEHAASFWAVVLGLLVIVLALLMSAVLVRTIASRATRPLRESEQRNRELIELSLGLICIHDMNGILLDVNPAAVEALGFTSRDELVGRSLSELVSPTSQDFGDYLRQVGSTGRAEGLMRVIDRSGRERIWSYRNHRVEESGGRVSVIGHASDITERWQAQRRTARMAIRESEERFRILLASVTDYAIVMLDPLGRVVSWNEGAERITGYAEHEVLGLPATTFALREEREQIAGYLAAAAATGRSEWEVTRLRKDGRSYSASSTLTRILNEDGILRGFAVVVRDVSERAELERRRYEMLVTAKELADEWTRTFDAVHVPMVMLDASGEICRLNRAVQELAKRPFSELMHRGASEIEGEPWQSIAQVAEQTFAGGNPAMVRAADGESVWQVSSCMTESGPNARVVVVAYDLTRVARLEAMLRRNEVAAAMGAMVAGVAHEVRNPLFTISATLDAWKAREGESEASRRYSDTLTDQVERLSRLVRDLLDYGRPHPLVLSSASLGDAIRAAADDCSVTANACNATVVLDLDGGLPPAVIDAARLEQVFQNVIDNALQHSPAGGIVRVEAAIEEKTFVCRVVDEGPGVTAEDIAKGFTPFYSHRRGGTGLGLSIARNIVARHGGEIALSARTDRSGTVVTIRLPTEQTHPSAELELAAW
jgi:PAS domain S-box-containing protein